MHDFSRHTRAETADRIAAWEARIAKIRDPTGTHSSLDLADGKAEALRTQPRKDWRPRAGSVEVTPEMQHEINGVIGQLRHIMAMNLNRTLDTFRQWDTNQDNLINYREFGLALAALGVVGRKGAINATFRSFDLDGSGQVDYRELHHTLRRRETDPSYSQAWANHRSVSSPRTGSSPRGPSSPRVTSPATSLIDTEAARRARAWVTSNLTSQERNPTWAPTHLHPTISPLPPMIAPMDEREVGVMRQAMVSLHEMIGSKARASQITSSQVVSGHEMAGSTLRARSPTHTRTHTNYYAGGEAEQWRPVKNSPLLCAHDADVASATPASRYGSLVSPRRAKASHATSRQETADHGVLSSPRGGPAAFMTTQMVAPPAQAHHPRSARGYM